MTIDLDLTAEQRQIVAAIQDVLIDKFPLARFRNVRGGNHDHATLPELARLGWLSLTISENQGGAGLTLVEDVLLFRELGRHLVTPCVLAGSIAVQAALAAGDKELAAGLMQGRLRACLAQKLDDTTHAIFDTFGADYVVTWDGRHVACRPAETIASGVPGRCIDHTVSLARAALPQGGIHLRDESAQALRGRADLLVAAQLLGIIEAALALAVDYAKLRRQFGQPIGAFQAIKHRCADIKVKARVLSALVLMAALSSASGREEATVQIASARLLAARYARDAAAAGIQIHGGMGFTAECDAHLFLLRTHLLENLGATAAEREIELGFLP
jgi:alkylation response protein AidB-like acyl-CoA dehydrogenase